VDVILNSCTEKKDMNIYNMYFMYKKKTFFFYIILELGNGVDMVLRWK